MIEAAAADVLGVHAALDQMRFAQAEKWYRLEFEIAVLKGDARAKDRILKLLGLEKSQ